MLGMAIRLATPEGCSAARLCLTHTGFRLAGQHAVGLLVSIAVVAIRLRVIMPKGTLSVNGYPQLAQPTQAVSNRT